MVYEVYWSKILKITPDGVIINYIINNKIYRARFLNRYFGGFIEGEIFELKVYNIGGLEVVKIRDKQERVRVIY